jgi:hypothetical protein
MACVARAFSIHGVVVVGVSEAPTPRLLGEGRTKLLSPLDTVKNSIAVSSIMACRGVDALLRVEPMKMVPLSPILGERLRPLM